jgi:hypothetical protein
MEDIHDGSSNEGQEGQGQSDGAQDPVKNIKAEFERKLGNVTEQLRAQSEMLQRTLEQMQAAKNTPAAAEEEIDPIVNPVAYKQAIKEEAKREMRSEIQLSQATQNEVARIQGMYPEFGENGSEAAKMALDKFKSLPSHLKGTPEGAKLVLMETAAEMGLIPASRRRKSEAEDDYTVGGGSSGTNRPQRQQATKLDNKTLAFAELIGLDINNPETRKSLESRTKRRNWEQYE